MKSMRHETSFYFRESYYLAKELEKAVMEHAARLDQMADEVLCAAENAVLAARREYTPYLLSSDKPESIHFAPVSADLTGAVKVTREGWTEIRLDTLLQSARRKSTGYIENTILRLLHAYRENNGQLPWYARALIAITEHTTRGGGNTYDADNREWKCVANALKGVLFEDDDQFTVSLFLDSVWDGKGYTEIAVVPYQDAAVYLTGRGVGR